ncbi:hypothetical protein HDV05_004292 [Chytridiales sp. JEL 0842]|nr:hypothetical protein HDV05_004292 [Chytridiales sp. JEL 0842]
MVGPLILFYLFRSINMFDLPVSNSLVVWFLGHITTVVQAVIYMTYGRFLASGPRNYSKAIWATLLSYGIILYKAHGIPQFNKMYLQRVMTDENTQYLLLALIWLTSKPVWVVLLPFATFSFFHSIHYIRSEVLPTLFPSSSPMHASITLKIAPLLLSFSQKYQALALKMVSYAEVILIFPYLCLSVLFGYVSFFTPVLYAQFLRFRFFFSPMTRQAFGEVKVRMDKWILGNEKVPAAVKSGYLKVVEFLVKWGDQGVAGGAAGAGRGAAAHKNFQFFPRLAERLLKDLGISSLRFDVRGNGESSGTMKFMDLFSEVDDIEAVVSFLMERNWRIHAVLGHSRGGNLALMFAGRHPDWARYIINVSGRFNIATGIKAKMLPQFHQLQQEGSFSFPLKRMGDIEQVKVDQQSWDQLHPVDAVVKKMVHLPRRLHVLTCHGTSDEVVPVEDSGIIASSIPTHTLKLFPDANHNYSNDDGVHSEFLVSGIIEWLDEVERGMGSFLRCYLGEGRVVNVGGVQNFRDAGGYPCGNGKFVKRGLVYRCADLSEITSTGLSTLQSLSTRLLFDLRSNPELAKRPPKTLKGIERIHVPVFQDEDYSPRALGVRWKLYTEAAEGFSKAYMQILKSGSGAFQTILKRILSLNSPQSPFSEGPSADTTTVSEPGAIVVHCTAGKDRTGVFVALLLSFLGVEDDIIAKDYALTEGFLRYSDEDIIKYSKATNGAISPDGIRTMLSAKPEAMLMFLKRVRETYISVERYFLAKCGIQPVDLEELRRVLVEERVGAEGEEERLVRAFL